MKDKYTGDIGDFVKIILLNELSSISNTTLGINWYYNKRKYSYEKNQKDGKHIDYLLNDKKGIKKYAPTIYQSLQEIIQNKNRKIKNLFGLINSNLHFYKEVPNKNKRTQWINDSLNELSTANLIFLDPDNGICYDDKNGNVKHVLQKEIVQMYQAGKSLFIYNHVDRKSHDEYLEKFKTISGKLNPKPNKIFILRASLLSARDYAFFVHDTFQNVIERKLIETERKFPALFKLSVLLDNHKDSLLVANIKELFLNIISPDFQMLKRSFISKWGKVDFIGTQRTDLKHHVKEFLEFENEDNLYQFLLKEKKLSIDFQEFEKAGQLSTLIRLLNNETKSNFFELFFEIELNKGEIKVYFHTNSLTFKYEMIGNK